MQCQVWLAITTSVINMAHLLPYLKSTTFRVYLFSQAKKSYFASTYFREWQAFDNFEFINFSPKEKRIRKRMEIYISMEKDC